MQQLHYWVTFDCHIIPLQFPSCIWNGTGTPALTNASRELWSTEYDELTLTCRPWFASTYSYKVGENNTQSKTILKCWSGTYANQIPFLLFSKQLTFTIHCMSNIYSWFAFFSKPDQVCLVLSHYCIVSGTSFTFFNHSRKAYVNPKLFRINCAETWCDDDDDERRINFSVALSPKTTRTWNKKPKQ